MHLPSRQPSCGLGQGLKPYRPPLQGYLEHILYTPALGRKSSAHNSSLDATRRINAVKPPGIGFNVAGDVFSPGRPLDKSIKEQVPSDAAVYLSSQARKWRYYDHTCANSRLTRPVFLVCTITFFLVICNVIHMVNVIIIKLSKFNIIKFKFYA